MKQDMILVLDLGSEENPKIAREIRALGVYTEIHAHDISSAELAAAAKCQRYHSERRTQSGRGWRRDRCFTGGVRIRLSDF